MSSVPGDDGPHTDIVYPQAIPFLLVHLSCLLAFWTGVTWQALVICVALYWLRIFAIGAGYHRYFSHRDVYKRQHHRRALLRPIDVGQVRALRTAPSTDSVRRSWG